MIRIEVNQIVFGLQCGVLGATANRMGVWTQGCSLPKCPGCTSTHTWLPGGGKAVSVETVLQLARAQSTPPSGLTVSGGEPTDQADAVAELICGFRQAFHGTEVVLYSGLRWPVLAARHPTLVALLDVAVTGPFVGALAAMPLAGSSNQEVQLLTPLAGRLYRDWPSWPRHLLQVGNARAEKVITVGIPHTQRIARAAKEVAAVEVTWDRIKKASDRHER